jgi:hypothetical protein
MKKVKGKVVPADSVKACSGGTGTAPLTNLSIRRSLIVKFTSCPLHIWERTPVPIEQDTVRVSELVWTI